MWFGGESNSPRPQCGFANFPLPQRTWSLWQKVFWRFQRAVNRLLGRASRPYWQMALFEKGAQ